MSLTFEQREIDLGDGESARVVVARPNRAIVVGRERLESMRLGLGPSGADEAIIAACRHFRAQVSVFCPEAPEQGGSWRFAPDLTPDDHRELANLLLSSQLATYQKMIEVGVCMHMRVGMAGPEQDALRDARDHHLERLEACGISPIRTGHHPTDEDLEHWILHNFTFFFGMNLDRVLTETLPQNARTMRRRIERMGVLRETLTR